MKLNKFTTFQYFEQDDPDLYLNKVKYILEHDVEEMDLYFVEEDYDQTGQLNKVNFKFLGNFCKKLFMWLTIFITLQVVELVPNGSKLRVRNSTKNQYLDALAQYRLATKVKDEVEAFLRGLNDLIPDNLLSIFDENELEVSKLDQYYVVYSK